MGAVVGILCGMKGSCSCIYYNHFGFVVKEIRAADPFPAGPSRASGGLGVGRLLERDERSLIAGT
jgi:hypothetical protein